MSQRSSRTSADRGFALLVVVLLLLAGTVVAHGLLELARVEHAVAVVSRDVVQARLAARSGAIEVAEGPLSEGIRKTSAGAVADSIARSAGRAHMRSRLRRLSLEVWLAEGEGVVGSARHSSARAMWALDPHARVDAFPAVVVTGRRTSGGAGGITASGTFREGVYRPAEGCGPFEADSLLVDSSHVDPLPLLVDSLRTFSELGLLTGSGVVLGSLDPVAGPVTPGPSEGLGVCVDGPANWGDPRAQGRWCRERWAAVRAPSFLEVDGGVGQGVLVLDSGGVLRDVDFFGLVIAEGPLELDGETMLRGFVIARGGLTIGARAEVRGSACWAWAALRHPGLASLQPLPGSGWMWSESGG